MSPRDEARSTARVMIGAAVLLALLTFAFHDADADARAEEAQAAIHQQPLDTLLTSLGYAQSNPPANSSTSAEEEADPEPRETDRTNYAARFSGFRLAALGELK